MNVLNSIKTISLIHGLFCFSLVGGKDERRIKAELLFCCASRNKI